MAKRMTYLRRIFITRLGLFGAVPLVVGLLFSANGFAAPVLCIDSPQDAAQRALVKALIQRNSARALALIPRIHDLNFRMSKPCGAPLDGAISWQNEPLIAAMVQHGAKSNFGADAMEVEIANQSGKSEDDILRVLQILKPVISPGGADALISAAGLKQHRVMAWLIAHGANTFGTAPCGGDDALQISMRVDDLEGVTLQLNSRAKGKDDDNPLVSAVIRARPDVVKLVLAHGADPNLVRKKTEFVEDSLPADAVLTMMSVLEESVTLQAKRGQAMTPQEAERAANLWTGSILLRIGPAEPSDVDEARRNLQVIALELKTAGARPGTPSRDPRFGTSYVPCD